MAKSKTQKEQHPLYNTWAWMRRMSIKATMADEWKQDFYSFVVDVGDRPSPQHRLYRKNEALGYSKENCEWREIISCEDSAKYQREWRKRNSEKSRGYDLQRTYGISLTEYNQLLDNQNGVCAICKQTESVSRYTNLAVDHCHATGKVRGLLCATCNRALGMFRDDRSILQNAIDYLA